MPKRTRTLFTRSFWADAGERSLKSAAQAVLGTELVADRAFSVLHADASVLIGAAGTGALLSILTSIVSAPVGGQGASLVNTTPEG